MTPADLKHKAQISKPAERTLHSQDNKQQSREPPLTNPKLSWQVSVNGGTKNVNMCNGVLLAAYNIKILKDAEMNRILAYS